MKIDIVYMWVDGGDAKWRKKRDAALRAAGRAVPAHSRDPRRFDDGGELKYSLRSVEKFAPWINHIWIITDGQRPKWLANNPRVSIVDHKEIIPKKLLPTFNSNMIEFYIPKIRGLSEHFLLANDDMFFGRPVGPDFFFDESGNPIVIMGAARRTGNGGVWSRTCLNAQMVACDFRFRFKHAIEPMRKSYMAENLTRGILAASSTPFRDSENVQRMVLPLLDNAKCRNKIVFRHTIGVRRGRFGFWTRLFSRGVTVDNINMNRAARHLKNMPATFCVNGTTRLNNFARNIGAMNKLFPKKSKFEK